MIGKILLLEDRYRDDFDVLAGTPEMERSALLEAWEGWARGEEDCKRPDGISETSRLWAASDPHLATIELGPYITLAATLVAAPLGGDLSDELSDLVRRLFGPSHADRGLAQEAIARRTLSERRRVVADLLARARLLKDIEAAVEALVGIASHTPELANQVVTGIRQECWRHLEPVSVAVIGGSNVPELVALLPELAADPDLQTDVRNAAKNMLEA